jgi:hypothetical protein
MRITGSTLCFWLLTTPKTSVEETEFLIQVAVFRPRLPHTLDPEIALYFGRPITLSTALAG